MSGGARTCCSGLILFALSGCLYIWCHQKQNTKGETKRRIQSHMYSCNTTPYNTKKQSTVCLQTDTRRHKVKKRVDLEFLGEQGVWPESVIDDQEENSRQGRLRMGRGHLIWDSFDGQKGPSICLCTVAWLQKRAIRRCLVRFGCSQIRVPCSSSVIVQHHLSDVSLTSCASLILILILRLLPSTRLFTATHRRRQSTIGYPTAPQPSRSSTHGSTAQSSLKPPPSTNTHRTSLGFWGTSKSAASTPNLSQLANNNPDVGTYPPLGPGAPGTGAGAAAAVGSTSGLSGSVTGSVSDPIGSTVSGGGEGNSSSSFQQRRKRSESIGGLKVCCVQERVFLILRGGKEKRRRK